MSQQIDWTVVANYLDEEYRILRKRAESLAPSGDLAPDREMLTRAKIFGTLAEALRAGLRAGSPIKRMS